MLGRWGQHVGTLIWREYYYREVHLLRHLLGLLGFGLKPRLKTIWYSDCGCQWMYSLTALLQLWRNWSHFRSLDKIFQFGLIRCRGRLCLWLVCWVEGAKTLSEVVLDVYFVWLQHQLVHGLAVFLSAWVDFGCWATHLIFIIRHHGIIFILIPHGLVCRKNCYHVIVRFEAVLARVVTPIILILTPDRDIHIG